MDKKKLTLIILPIVFLLLLVVGATFAYFNVDVNNSFSTVKFTATTEEVGSVSITTGASLSINLSNEDMRPQSSNVAYYATEDGTASTTPTEVTIGTMNAVGDKPMYCSYKITPDISGTMYDAWQSYSWVDDEFILILNGIEYDFTNAEIETAKKMEITYIAEGEPQIITAGFKVINRTDLDQSYLAGTNLEINFNISDFNCEMISN